jgi:hypothetical protein
MCRTVSRKRGVPTTGVNHRLLGAAPSTHRVKKLAVLQVFTAAEVPDAETALLLPSDGSS